MSAIGALVQKVLAPLMQKTPPSSSALVSNANASEPDTDSVIAFAAITDPLLNPGRSRDFCSLEPCFQIGTTHANRWAQTENVSPPSSQPSPSASSATTAETGSSPRPPCSCGTTRPCKRCSPHFSHKSREKI